MVLKIIFLARCLLSGIYLERVTEEKFEVKGVTTFIALNTRYEEKIWKFNLGLTFRQK